MNRGAQLLAKFRLEQDMSQMQFCRLLGRLAPPAVSLLEHGKQGPSLPIATLIEEKTVGAVPMQAWDEGPTPELDGEIAALRAKQQHAKPKSAGAASAKKSAA